MSKQRQHFVVRFGFREITGLHAVTAVWYDARGDYSNAALSAAACIPLAGIAAAGAKFASKGVKAAKAANKFGNVASVAKKTISSLKKGVGEAAAKVADAVYASTKSGKKTVAVKVADKVQSAVSTVKKSISDGWNKLKSAFGSKGSAKSVTTADTNLTKGGLDTIIKDGKISVNDVKNNPEAFCGKSTEELADALRNSNYDVTIKNSTRSRSGAQIIQVNNPGGGKKYFTSSSFARRGTSW